MPQQTPERDEFLYLETLQSPEVDAWLSRHNEATEREFKATPEFHELFKEIYEILASKEKVPSPTVSGPWVYNFWRDENNDRGIWRRSRKSAFEEGAPDWELLLDIDELSRREGKKWSFQGAIHCLQKPELAFIVLSEGGRDTAVWREFNVEAKSFVENGFRFPEGKHRVTWLNENQVVACLTSAGWDSTNAGYPMEARLLSRDGTERPLLRGEKSDALLAADSSLFRGEAFVLLHRMIDYHNTELHLLRDDRLIKLDLPKDFRGYGLFDGSRNGLKATLFVFQNNDDFERDGTKYAAGSLLSLSLDDLHSVELICAPPKRGSIDDVYPLRDRLLVILLENVQSRAHAFRIEHGKWVSEPLEAGDFISLRTLDSLTPEPEDIYLWRTGFLSPYEVLKFRGGQITELPWKGKEWFKSDDYQVRQEWAVSRDGTRVPYFVVSPKTAPPGAPKAALMTAYGGFASSEIPYYLSTVGRAWLSRGGSFILANIRGGAEFGPAWHMTAIKENRQRCYDDLIAVSEDALAKGVCERGRLGLMGGSNGGLLVGAMLTQRPDLFGALVCAMPLLDMLRYTDLPPGSLWTAEYGDPKDPEAAKYIRKYSPYHNVKEGIAYPPTLFVTSTFDDRVHPGHARKMAAKMESMGHKPWFFEQRTGGHQLNDGLKDPAEFQALEYAFLARSLMRS